METLNPNSPILCMHLVIFPIYELSNHFCCSLYPKEWLWSIKSKCWSRISNLQLNFINPLTIFSNLKPNLLYLLIRHFYELFQLNNCFLIQRIIRPPQSKKFELKLQTLIQNSLILSYLPSSWNTRLSTTNLCFPLLIYQPWVFYRPLLVQFSSFASNYLHFNSKNDLVSSIQKL